MATKLRLKFAIKDNYYMVLFNKRSYSCFIFGRIYYLCRHKILTTMTEKEIKELYRQLADGHMKEDIIVVEDNHRMPIFGEEYRTQYLYMGICVSGYSKGQYDYHDYYFKAGDICWLLPNHVMRHDEVSEDYSVLSVFINTAYYQKLSSSGSLPRHYYPFFVTSIPLNHEQFDLMVNGYRMIGKLARFNHPLRDEFICKMCDVLAILGDEFILQKAPDLHSEISWMIRKNANSFNCI